MRDDQWIRGLGIAAVAVVVSVRLVTVGNGPMTILGARATPFAVAVGAIVVLALPETIDMLPFGPSTRSKKE